MDTERENPPPGRAVVLHLAAGDTPAPAEKPALFEECPICRTLLEVATLQSEIVRQKIENPAVSAPHHVAFVRSRARCPECAGAVQFARAMWEQRSGVMDLATELFLKAQDPIGTLFNRIDEALGSLYAAGGDEAERASLCEDAMRRVLVDEPFGLSGGDLFPRGQSSEGGALEPSEDARDIVATMERVVFVRHELEQLGWQDLADEVGWREPNASQYRLRARSRGPQAGITKLYGALDDALREGPRFPTAGARHEMVAQIAGRWLGREVTEANVRQALSKREDRSRERRAIRRV